MNSFDNSKFHGMVLYDIELNGCLNGVFSNNHGTVDGIIYNEIARKNSNNNNENGIVGNYTCSYIDVVNTRNGVTLTISLIGTSNGTYSFVWSDDTRTIFTGIGFIMNQKQIAVYYQTCD